MAETRFSAILNSMGNAEKLITEQVRDLTIELLRDSGKAIKKQDLIALIQGHLSEADPGTISTQINETALRHPDLVDRPSLGWYVYIGPIAS